MTLSTAPTYWQGIHTHLAYWPLLHCRSFRSSSLTDSTGTGPFNFFQYPNCVNQHGFSNKIMSCFLCHEMAITTACIRSNSFHILRTVWYRSNRQKSFIIFKRLLVFAMFSEKNKTDEISVYNGTNSIQAFKRVNRHWGTPVLNCNIWLSATYSKMNR